MYYVLFLNLFFLAIIIGNSFLFSEDLHDEKHYVLITILINFLSPYGIEQTLNSKPSKGETARVLFRINNLK